MEIARSVRVPSLNRESNETFSGAQVNSVKAFLSTHAIRTTSEYFITEDDIEGIDWNSSTPPPRLTWKVCMFPFSLWE